MNGTGLTGLSEIIPAKSTKWPGQQPAELPLPGRRQPIYTYLHGPEAPPYVIADNVFQGAFGGSFLNHQVLVAAQAPVFPGADHSGQTTGCATGTTAPADTLCGDYGQARKI